VGHEGRDAVVSRHKSAESLQVHELARLLAVAEATIANLIAGPLDAVVDSKSPTPVLLATAQSALRESEERYRRIVETTSEGVWQIDADQKTTFMNRRMAQMLGCEADMGIGRSPLEFLDDEGRTAFAEHLARPGSQQVEVRFVRLDGTAVWALMETSPVFDRGGISIGSFAMVMDITQRKEAEAALRASEARFRCLWDSGVLLLAVTDLTGSITEINDAGLCMLGYEREELLSRRLGWDEVTPPEWRGADQAARALHAGTRGTPPREKELLRKDGSRVSVLEASAVLDGIEGIMIAVDLSDRKRAERALLERMRIAALTADVGMLIAHEATLQTTLDRSAAALVEHLGVSFARIWTLDARAGILELKASQGRPLELDGPHGRVPIGKLGIGRIAQDRQPLRLNHFAVDARPGDPKFDGITAVAGQPLIVNDELIGVLAIYSTEPISDPAFAGLAPISNALAVEILRKRITSTNAALEAQLRQAQKMEAIGRLAGGIAHDFNNILTVILTSGELLLEELKHEDPARSEVEEICKAGTRAAALTRQLLMFSRRQVLEPRVLDLAAITANLESMLRRVVGEDIELVLRNEPGLGSVRADPGSIEQVIMNLVVNARDAMPTGGTLTIETRNEPGDEIAQDHHRVVLSITDTGTGMTAATQAQIFDPFFTTKDVGKGTGLGLSTVFGIVEQSNGEIRVRSEPGVGTTFTISLPHLDAEPDVAISRTGVAQRGSETILLVEDEAQVRAVASALLRRQGYDVLEMRSGAEALAYCRSHAAPIHLLVTDVVMPQISGPVLFRQLVELRPQLRVLCMSGYTDDSIVRHGVLQADLAYLQKPFTADSLGRKVREVLDAQPRGGELASARS